MPTRDETWPPKWRNQPIVLYHGTDEDSAEKILAHGVDVYGPVAKRWGPDEYRVVPEFDQVSFHGDMANEFLHDVKSCEIGVER